MENNLHHWRLKQNEKIAWLFFDKKNKSVNTIDKSVLVELSALLKCIEKNKSMQGLVVTSSKPNSFIVGADILTICSLSNEKEVSDFILQGQLVFHQLAGLKIPTVALIKGLCLGGGLELALACRYRIAIDDPQTRFGMPEVKLGMHSAWGGTVRLPPLLGAFKALELMLNGNMLSAQAAAKVALVDCVVPERQAETAALFYINVQKQSQGFELKNLSNLSYVRNVIASFFRRRLMAKVNPQHYPAPYQILALWRKVGVTNEAFLDEAKSLSRLVMTPSTRHLIHIHFLKERLSQFGKKYSGTFKHVHVVGASTMGGDIAAWCALQGMYVTLQDTEPKYLAPAMERAYALFKKRLKNPYDIQLAMDRLLPDVQGYGMRRADLVIEAVFEDLTIKQNVFRQLESQVNPNTILATHTSSILLEDIQQALKQPERLIGLHFFNPIAEMPLVEVIQSKINLPEVIQQGLGFVQQINRLPLPVKSSPGFLINRLLMTYLLHAVILLEKGMPAALIDKAALHFGMPIGPLELADTIGLDICLTLAKILHRALQSPLPERLEKMVGSRLLGKKTKQGFYRYNNKGQALKEKIPHDYQVPNDLIGRLIDPMIVEANKCLREKVVADIDLLDAGVAFGTHFPHFRGGLMQYAKEATKRKINTELA